MKQQLYLSDNDELKIAQIVDIQFYYKKNNQVMDAKSIFEVPVMTNLKEHPLYDGIFGCLDKQPCQISNLLTEA